MPDQAVEAFFYTSLVVSSYSPLALIATKEAICKESLIPFAKFGT